VATWKEVIINILLQEWDQLLEQQREIEDKLQELEASPPRYAFV
jgi:lysine-specific histone demethylase 1